MALPGGDLAAKQPWRNLLAQCRALCRSGRITLKQQVCNSKTGACWRGPLSVELTRRWRHRVGVFSMQWRRQLGCAPATLSYEGEAACALEALAASCHGVTHPVTMPRVDNQLDLATFWQQWLNWLAPVNQRAWAFHDALAQGFAALMREQATMRGVTTLVFSGGVIHNRLLRARLAVISLISHCSFHRVYRRVMAVCLWGRGLLLRRVGSWVKSRTDKTFGHHCRMRRKRLIRPTHRPPWVG